MRLNRSILILSLAILAASSVAKAQEQQGDVYDPFVDYSEFEEAGDEQKDVHFFRNGRLFTAGLFFGQQMGTGNMGKVMDPAVGFGAFFSYFFDMNMALSFSYFTATHDVSYRLTGSTVTGESTIGNFGINFKYYLKSQNLTKGLPQLNPYMVGGFSAYNRQVKGDGQAEVATDTSTGFNIGAGIELPLVHNKSYLGVQGMYSLVSFDGEGSSTVKQDGDLFNLLAFMGFNF